MTLQRLLLPCRLAAALLILGLTALPQTAAAQSEQNQEQAIPDQVFGDWRLKCLPNPENQGETCVLLQDIIDKSGEKTRHLMQVAIGFWGPERRRGALITLPLGVVLPAGIRLDVDSTEIGKIPYYACPVNGCQVHIVLDDSLLTKLKKGNKGKVTFHDPSGKAVPVDFSLKGFTAGFDGVK